LKIHANTRQYSKQQDLDLLGAVARGDTQALDALYLGYHRRLARFLSRIAPRYDTVEEIINDTFMVVWQHAKEFRGASRVSTWIIGIAYRIALKSLRGNDGLQRAQSSNDLPEESVDPTAAAELRDWIAHALNHLPLEQRLTLELAYHMGHSIEEIAEITGCPSGTVKARMFHAREKLRRSLPALGGIAAADILNDSRQL
jgi:RNA polymerase sigma-70 factor (ECF subfamily)